jgi:peptidyl-dipeptidase Dcp
LNSTLKIKLYNNERFIIKIHYKTRYSTFSQIKNEDYATSIQEGIALAKAEIDAIANNPEAPTFENTIVAMDYTGDILDRASSIFFLI